MKRRIFIAINLPENIRDELIKYQKKWLDLPVRWTKRENLHLTLVFIGYVNDQEIAKICQAVRETVSRKPSFSINLTKIIYGPPKKKPFRMIWLEGEKNEQMAILKKDLEKSLVDSEINFIQENRDFHLHLTLARIKTWQWREMEPEEIPEINEDISLTFQVNSIEIMESQLRRQGPIYTILESIKLK